ncbi:hypothetical protein F4678DRAFT_466437 [Xylaria arbuscula]|nr:hypothetical protein F4678DRAFT_466437 [Xylaria arbuscula]
MDSSLADTDSVPCDRIIQGCESIFKCIFDDGRLPLFASEVIDNGVGQGYTAYDNDAPIFRGKLRVFDAVDEEIDLLNGGPLGYGWFTNKPPSFVEPPPDVVTNYTDQKWTMRQRCEGDLAFYQTVTGTGGKHDEESLGQSVKRFAPLDPWEFYGLGNWYSPSKCK